MIFIKESNNSRKIFYAFLNEIQYIRVVVCQVRASFLKFIHGFTSLWSDMWYWSYKVPRLTTILISIVGMRTEREDRLLSILCYPWQRILIDNGAFTLLRDDYKYSYVPENPVSRFKLQLQLVAFSTSEKFSIIVPDFVGDPDRSMDSYRTILAEIVKLQYSHLWDHRIDEVILTVQSQDKNQFFRSLFDVLDISSRYEEETGLRVRVATPSAFNETGNKIEFIKDSTAKLFVNLSHNRGLRTHFFGRCSNRFDLPEVLSIAKAGVDSFDTTRCHFLAKKMVILLESTDIDEIQSILKFRHLDYYTGILQKYKVKKPDLNYLSALMVATWGSVLETTNLNAHPWRIIKWR